MKKPNQVRRDVLTGVAGSALWLSLGSQAGSQPSDSSVDGSSPIRGVRVGEPTIIPGNDGDTWALAWADDDNLYSPVNDGCGFTDFAGAFGRLFSDKQRRLIENDPGASEKFEKGHEQEAVKAFGITSGQLQKLAALEQKGEEWQQQNLGAADTHIGFNRIIGSDPLKLTGANINVFRDFNSQDRGKQLPSAPDPFEVGPDGRTWKSSGCSFIDGALYLGISRHDYGDPFGKRLRQDAVNASFIRSTDYGRTWTRTAKQNRKSPMFPGARFATPYFIDYGQAKPAVDGADRYVYAISNNGFWDNGDTLVLGRVLRTKLADLNGADWEFFTGGKGLNGTNWSPDAAKAKSLLSDPMKLGETGAVYLPARRRYMMVTWYYPNGTGHELGAAHKTVWNFLESPHPWGPWTRVGSHTWFPQGFYCPGICPKFQSASRIYVMTAGDFTNGLAYYHLTAVPVDLA